MIPNPTPADFLYQNLEIQQNLIQGAFRIGVKRLIFLGSTCIYPKMAPQPLREGVIADPGNWSQPISGMPSQKIAGV